MEDMEPLLATFALISEPPLAADGFPGKVSRERKSLQIVGFSGFTSDSFTISRLDNEASTTNSLGTTHPSHCRIAASIR
jgi:hypothetical protein